MANVRAQIDQDIRNALLDLKSSSEQVEVAQSSVNLAEQALTQSRDRFSAESPTIWKWCRRRKQWRRRTRV